MTGLGNDNFIFLTYRRKEGLGKKEFILAIRNFNLELLHWFHSESTSFKGRNSLSLIVKLVFGFCIIRKCFHFDQIKFVVMGKIRGPLA